MVLNCLSNDMDLVQPTKYLTPKSRIAKKPPPTPEPLPPSQPLPIYMIWRATYHPCMQLIDWCTPGIFFLAFLGPRHMQLLSGAGRFGSRPSPRERVAVVSLK